MGSTTALSPSDLPQGKKQNNMVEPTIIGVYTWGRDFVVKGI
jgi:hypothetical protein